MGEITLSKKQLHNKDNEIMFLKNKINELEQYSRRNSTRLNCIPESKDEKSDDITKSARSNRVITWTEWSNRV